MWYLFITERLIDDYFFIRILFACFFSIIFTFSIVIFITFIKFRHHSFVLTFEFYVIFIYFIIIYIVFIIINIDFSCFFTFCTNGWCHFFIFIMAYKIIIL